MKPTNSAAVLAAAALTVAGTFPSVCIAQVDNPVFILARVDTVGGPDVVGTPPAIGAFGYRPADNSDPDNPVREAFFSAGFSQTTSQDIRRIDLETPTQVKEVTRLVTQTPWLQFIKAGDLTRNAGNPNPGSLVLNKTAIAGTSIGAYSSAFISDNAAQVMTGATNEYDLTQRLYRFDLRKDTNNDAREEMHSLVTLGQMRNAISYSGTSGSNLMRQVALSTDSATVYFNDSSSSATAFGGLWSVPSAGGQVKRLVKDDFNTEPAVANINGHDRVYFVGSAASPGGSNIGGLDYWDTEDSTRKVAMLGSTFADFAETTAAKVNILGTAADDDGNVYFQNSATPNSTTVERRGIFMLRPDGKIIKVVGYAERNATVVANISAETATSTSLKMQTRTATYAGSNGTFDRTQVMFAESSRNVSAIAGAFVFEPGDFDRDNGYTAAIDGVAFASKLTPMANTTTIAVGDSRYDLNGNNVVNYRDVKILQNFLGFLDGDANFDLTVNFDDLVPLAQNYNTMSGMTWAKGDFTGDDIVNFDDLVPLAQNYNMTVTLPGQLVVLGGAAFAADWSLARSLVPEPTMLAALSSGIAVFGSRRRRSNVG